MTALACSLPYLEFHLADHCNLNCKGCSHFCPLAPESFLSMEDFLRDMRRLAEIFAGIGRIRLMGGEPLLHPNVAAFAAGTRRLFPAGEISLVTNGMLLPAMNAGFYETLLENNIFLDISIYPATKAIMESCLALPAQYKIPMRLLSVHEFSKFIRPSGASDKDAIFRKCRINRYCTFLRGGKLFHCCLPGLSGILNEKFGLSLPGDAGVDIHAPVTAAAILDFLRRPSAACAYCQRPVWFPWQRSQGKKEEWIV